MKASVGEVTTVNYKVYQDTEFLVREGIIIGDKVSIGSHTAYL